MPENRNRQNGQEEGRDDESGYKNRIRETQRAEGKSKGGCIPKLFMLLLSFVAIGTFLFLRS